MAIPFVNSTQELTYRRVLDYLKTSMFRNAIRLAEDAPNVDLLYEGSTLIEVEVHSWELHPWEDSELAIVKASSHITVGSTTDAELTQFLLAENRKMRFGAFQLDEAGQALFTHSILGGENMDLVELQTCILSVAAIATSYADIISEKFGPQKLTSQTLVNL